MKPRRCVRILRNSLRCSTNTAVHSNFARINKLEVLCRLFPTPHIPKRSSPPQTYGILILKSTKSTIPSFVIMSTNKHNTCSLFQTGSNMSQHNNHAKHIPYHLLPDNRGINHTMRDHLRDLFTLPCRVCSNRYMHVPTPSQEVLSK